MITVDTCRGRYPGGYGQTEVVGMLTFARWATAIDAWAASPLMQVRAVDPDDLRSAGGEVGEICAAPLCERLLEPS
jgi:acyl-coenzyme A synthetase/AMP-(fatty) acid ligase